MLALVPQLDSMVTGSQRVTSRLLCPWNSPERILEWVAMPVFSGSSWPRDQTQSTAMHAHTLPSEPSEKPKYRIDKNRWNRIESPKINSFCIVFYCQWMFNKGDKPFSKKRTVFQQTVLKQLEWSAKSIKTQKKT